MNDVLAPHMTMNGQVGVLDNLALDDHRRSVTFFYDDGAMNHDEEECELFTHSWWAVVRSPLPGGYTEAAFEVSSELAAELDRITSREVPS